MSGTMGRRPARKRRSKVDRREADRRTSGSAAYEEAERRMMERRIGDRRTVGLGSVHVRSWTVVAFVAVVALGGGVMVAGVPSSSEAFVLPASATSTTVSPATSAPLAGDPVPVGELVVVLAHGVGGSGQATRAAADLEELGYATPETVRASEPIEETVVFFAAGFEDEAARLADDLEVPDASVEPMPDDPVTTDDSGGDADLVVILGPSD